MIINKQWLGRLYREEASDEGSAESGASETNQEEAVQESTAEEIQTPEWLQGKYITEGKTQEESIAEQAKAYNELSGKFGAFTGAPDEYAETALSDELKEMGIEIANDDPMLQAAREFAKKSNMSQQDSDL